MSEIIEKLLNIKKEHDVSSKEIFNEWIQEHYTKTIVPLLFEEAKKGNSCSDLTIVVPENILSHLNPRNLYRFMKEFFSSEGYELTTYGNEYLYGIKDFSRHKAYSFNITLYWG